MKRHERNLADFVEEWAKLDVGKTIEEWFKIDVDVSKSVEEWAKLKGQII